MHWRSNHWRWLRQGLLVAGIAAGCLPAGSQQNTPKQVLVDESTLEGLLARIDRLETRVQELEGRKAAADLSAAAEGRTSLPLFSESPMSMTSETAAAPVLPPAAKKDDSKLQVEAEQKHSENQMERMDVSQTLLRIRGFGDITFHGDTRPGDNTAFSLGQLDLFVTSDVSDRFRFLSEIIFEGGPDNFYGVTTGEKNSFSVDLERYLLQYSWNDYFNLSVGRGHTAIGYYNTAYHHSAWLQTAMGRPFLFDFEDRGGILPVHMVGAELSGQIPSGALGLHYVAEVGNGRASRDALNEEPVQNVTDDQSHKAYNFAVFSRPNAVHGLQAGLSIYRDLLAPQNQPAIAESILAGHVVLIRPRYEWLSEALLDRHAVRDGRVFNTPGFYTQMSRQWKSYRPYMRYQYVNVAKDEPVFPVVALRHGPSVGLRYDPTESVALKLQYDYTMMRDVAAVNSLGMQVGFTF